MSSFIESTENLSRFIFSSSHIRNFDKTVRHSAFLPAKDGDTSVFRTSGLSEENISEIVDNEFKNEMKVKFKGRADLYASSVITNGLSVIPHEPPIRHANITNWPIEKSKQKEIALELASEAKLQLG